MRFQSVRINPLGIASGVFLLLAPFGQWMTLSAFGFVSGSDIWQISNSQTSFPISMDVTSSALYLGTILIAAGFVSFWRTRFGLPVATGAVLVFVIESYSAFGTFPGPIPVSILPGTGFFLALSGIAFGLGALRTSEVPVKVFLSSLRTRQGLGVVGILLMSTFLAADGWNHWSSGQLSEFLGTTLLEGIIHRIFILGALALLMFFVVQRSMFLESAGGVLVLATFGALILDAGYHFATGSVVGFVGHEGTEVLFHALTYYGAAILVVARFLVKR
jgi:hypothetical protein